MRVSTLAFLCDRPTASPAADQPTSLASLLVLQFLALRARYLLAYISDTSHHVMGVERCQSLNLHPLTARQIHLIRVLPGALPVMFLMLQKLFRHIACNFFGHVLGDQTMTFSIGMGIDFAIHQGINISPLKSSLYVGNRITSSMPPDILEQRLKLTRLPTKEKYHQWDSSFVAQRHEFC